MLNFRKLILSIENFRAIILIAVATFFISLGFSIVNISALPVFVAQNLHAVKWVGFILGVTYIFDTLSRPFLGVLGDRIGRRYPVIVGPVLVAITSAITVYISFGVLFGLRVIDGLAAGALWSSVYAETGDLSRPEQRNTAMGVVTTAYIMALAVGPLIGSLSDIKFGHLFHTPIQASFTLTAILLMIGSIVAFFVFRSWKIKKLEFDKKEWIGFRLSDLSFTFKKFPEMLLVALVMFMAIGLISPIAKLYAIDHFGMSELTFGTVLAVAAISLGVLAIPLARLGDLWDVRRSMFYGLILSALGMWGLTFGDNIYWAIISAIVLGLGFIVALPAWLSLITKVAPKERRGEVIGVIGLGQGFGILIGSALSGILFVSEFSIPNFAIRPTSLPFLLSAVLLSISMFLVYFWIYRRS